MRHLIPIENCLSTNDEVIKYIKKDDEYVAVFTFNQTKGRGQYGNEWQILPNQNIAYTLALKASQVFLSDILLNYYTAIIVRDFIANLAQSFVCKIKWPNDIILSGKKICGILLEKRKIAQEEYYLIGIGINVLQTDFTHLPKAGSILTTTGLSFDLETVVRDFHHYLIHQLTTVVSENFVVNQYNNHLFKKNEVAVFKTKILRQNGIIKNADNLGYLWIDLEHDGLCRFFHKEIELLY